MSVLVADGLATAVDDGPRCPACAARLADDQRFCVSCGLRLAPDVLRLAALPLLTAAAPLAGVPVAAAGGPALRRPVVRSAAITAVVVLVLGIAIGATIGPAAVGETAAAQRAIVLVSAPAAAVPAAANEEPARDGEGDESPADEVQTLDDTAGEEPVPAVEEPTAEAPAPGDGGDDAGDESEEPTLAPPGSQSLAGIVASVAADGEGFTLAARDGTLLHVHASGCGVAPGDDLHLRARPLANGTWSADRVRRVGDGDTLRAAGTVVWSDPSSGRYALGARGVTLVVTVPPPAPAADPPNPVPPVDPQAPAATAPAAPVPPAVPALGAQLRVRLEPLAAHDGQPAGLVERVRRDAPPPADPAVPAPPLELAGVVQSTDAQARTLVLALDPAAQPPLVLTLAVPEQIDLVKLLPAQHVAVTAIPQPDGSLALSGASPDGDALAADDPTALQGDQAPSDLPDGDATTTTGVTACSVIDAPTA